MGIWRWLKRPDRKSEGMIGPPSYVMLMGFRFAWTALVSSWLSSEVGGGLAMELFWKIEYHSVVVRLGMSKMFLLDE